MNVTSFLEVNKKRRKTKYICDWIWENPPVMRKDKHIILIIQNTISQGSLNYRLVICHESIAIQGLCSYSLNNTLLAKFPAILDSFFINTINMVRNHEVAGYNGA